MSRLRPAALAALALTAASPAAAHVSLESGQAPANSTHRATFRVPHGCDGAATTRLTVRLPEGVTAARPMPKAGWTIRITPRSEAPSGHGAVADTAEISWEGGPLLDAHYDEFVIRFRLPDRQGQILHIPVVQDCEGGRSVGWVEVPEPGRRITDYRHPAPALRLTPRN